MHRRVGRNERQKESIVGQNLVLETQPLTAMDRKRYLKDKVARQWLYKFQQNLEEAKKSFYPWQRV